MAIILPHGVLFRGGAEARIRKKLLYDGHINTVIGLPTNLFYSTGIPVCILVLKKCKKPDLGYRSSNYSPDNRSINRSSNFSRSFHLVATFIFLAESSITVLPSSVTRMGKVSISHKSCANTR